MTHLPTAAELREWQLQQYQQLLETAKTKADIEFVTDALANFLKPVPC